MLVYGDAVRRVDSATALSEVRADLARASRLAGAARHDALVSALIGLGELAQGCADAEFAARGCDARSPLQDALSAALLRVARAVDASWRGQRAPAPLLDLPPLSDAVLELRRAEGFAFYALYPDAYAEAARGLGPRPGAVVLGLRSIGAPLAAIVAAALDAAPPLTVRPTGHPFDRRLVLAPELAAELRAAPCAVVVDEGPGLSGSSFAAAMDVFGDVPVAALPGHLGDLGQEAGAERRARWAAAERRVVEFDALMLRSGRLQQAAEALVGPATEPFVDLSGGAWRALRYTDAAAWPAAHTRQERRKFLMRADGGDWLLKFVGLGRVGEARLGRARDLHDVGFSAEAAGLVHGFLVERWIAPCAIATPPPLADYLAARIRFDAPREDGAAAATLLRMAQTNVAEALGEEAATSLERFEGELSAFQARVRPVETDNRMHEWEWIPTPDGRRFKTDALDHHAGHDLVGPQDIAWDVAGAEAEFDLDGDQVERLRRATNADAELLAFMRPCYLAFQLGYYAMAADAHAGWPAERARLQRERRRYETRLRVLLATL